MLPDDVICNINICADGTTLYSKCYQTSDLWQKLKLASELESDLRSTVDSGRKWNAGKTQLVSFESLITLVLLMLKWDEIALKEKAKSSFEMLWLTSSPKLGWGSHIIYLWLKLLPRNFEALIRPMKFLSPEVALYIYKSTIQPCIRILLSYLDWYSSLLLGIVK